MRRGVGVLAVAVDRCPAGCGAHPALVDETDCLGRVVPREGTRTGRMPFSSARWAIRVERWAIPRRALSGAHPHGQPAGAHARDHTLQLDTATGNPLESALVLRNGSISGPRSRCLRHRRKTSSPRLPCIRNTHGALPHPASRTAGRPPSRHLHPLDNPQEPDPRQIRRGREHFGAVRAHLICPQSVSDGSSGAERLSTAPATAGDASIFASNARSRTATFDSVSSPVRSTSPTTETRRGPTNSRRR